MGIYNQLKDKQPQVPEISANPSSPDLAEDDNSMKANEWFYILFDFQYQLNLWNLEINFRKTAKYSFCKNKISNSNTIIKDSHKRPMTIYELR